MEAAQATLAAARADLAALVGPGVAPAARRRAETLVQGAEIQVERARHGQNDAVPAVVSVEGVRIDELKLVAVPGELFDTALEATGLRARDDVMIVGLANGNIGYLPSHAGGKATTYEALRTPYGPMPPGGSSGTIERVARALSPAVRPTRNRDGDASTD